MISYFRINDPYRLVGLLVLLLLLYVPLFVLGSQLTIVELRDLIVGEKQNEGYRMYVGVVDNSAPLAAWTHEILDTVFDRSLLARHILAFLILFLQSVYVGILFITKKVFNENTFIPSFLFAVLFFFSWDTLTLSNELLGSGFLLLALSSIFQEIEFRQENDESVFNAGIFISLASLFAFSFIVYLPCAIVILSMFTRSDIRKFLLLIFGFLLPHLVVLSVAYLTSSTLETWKYYYLANLSFDRNVLVGGGTLLTLAALPLFYLVISLIMLNREARFSKYQSQILQATLLWLLFSCLFVLYAKDLRPQTLIVFFPGLSLLLTHFFLLIRRKKFAEMNAWILLLGISVMAYLAKFEKIDSVDYSGLMASEYTGAHRGKRVLVLGDDLGVYGSNYLATPFLNWQLSEPIFRNPDYYGNVTRVYHALKTDPPEIILDESNVLEKFLERMPEFKGYYQKQGDEYVRILSN